MRVFRNLGLFVLTIGLSTISSCKKGCTDSTADNYNEKAKKDDGTCTYTSFVELQFDHEVGTDALTFNDKTFTNAAGNVYSIETLKYYISNITFHQTDGTTFTVDGEHYRDASDASTRELLIDDFTDGTYDKLTFTFGLDEQTNETGGLENISVNNNMEWPDAMGGGYHYMKLEGKFVDTSSSTNEASYNIHYGATDGTPYHFEVTIEGGELNFDITEGKSYEVHVVVDINKWFEGNNNFDFNTYGSSIMGNPSAQEAIKANGEAGLFEVHHVVEAN